MNAQSLSIGELQRHFERYPQPLQDILYELRSIVLALRPETTERIDRSGLTYFDAAIGGPVKGGICGISIEDDHVRLGFIHGALLDDPKGLLEGERDYKRFVRIYSLKHVDWEAIQSLIKEQIRYIEQHHR